MKKMNAFYAQSGGVTAVINASACGVIETARKHKSRIGKVYAGRNGIIGALTEDLIDTGKETPSTIAALMHTTMSSKVMRLPGCTKPRALPLVPQERWWRSNHRRFIGQRSSLRTDQPVTQCT
jgi:hypothetical protein